jgi:hypothetical protein
MPIYEFVENEKVEDSNEVKEYFFVSELDEELKSIYCVESENKYYVSMTRSPLTIEGKYDPSAYKLPETEYIIYYYE